MSDTNICCGACKHWQRAPIGIAPDYGACLVPLPDSLSGDACTDGMHADEGQGCPCWAPKDIPQEGGK